jgi:hypothetical protein
MCNLKAKLTKLLADVGLCSYDTITEYLISNDTKVVIPCKKCKYLRRGRVVFSCKHPGGLKQPNLVQNTFCPYGEERLDEEKTDQ